MSTSGGGRTVPLEQRRERVDARVAELVELGGSIIRATESDDHYAAVMGDPEGNELCVA